MKTKKPKPTCWDQCPACTVSYIYHPGLTGICEKLQVAREALSHIRKLALNRATPFPRADLARLCADALAKSKP